MQGIDPVQVNYYRRQFEKRTSPWAPERIRERAAISCIGTSYTGKILFLNTVQLTRSSHRPPRVDTQEGFQPRDDRAQAGATSRTRREFHDLRGHDYSELVSLAKNVFGHVPQKSFRIPPHNVYATRGQSTISSARPS